MKRIVYLTVMFAGMLAIISAVCALMVFFETTWLQDHVYPVAGTKLPEWLDDFKWWATLGIIIASGITSHGTRLVFFVSDLTTGIGIMLGTGGCCFSQRCSLPSFLATCSPRKPFSGPVGPICSIY